MKNLRKKQFIGSAVQGALTRRIVLHWLILFALSAVTLPLWQVLRGGDFSAPLSKLMLTGMAETAPVFIILLALLPIFVRDTVTFSHRFAGPVYRIRQGIKGLAAGEDVRPIRLRKGDFWKDVAEDFNTMLENLASERERNEETNAERSLADASGYEEDIEVTSAN